jgi:hypothetical protein
VADVDGGRPGAELLAGLAERRVSSGAYQKTSLRWSPPKSPTFGRWAASTVLDLAAKLPSARPYHTGSLPAPGAYQKRSRRPSPLKSPVNGW